MYGLGIAGGMATTLKHFFRKPITVRYPEQKLGVPPRFRGYLRLLTDPESGALKCTACGVCARACPYGVIRLTVRQQGKQKKELVSYEADMGFCMYCGLCAESCPFDALELGEQYEGASYSREGMIINLHTPGFLKPLTEPWEPS